MEKGGIIVRMEIHQVGDVAVIVLVGKLELGNITLLRQMVKGRFAVGIHKVLLHMKDVNRIDEAAIRALSALVAENKGGQLKLVHVERVKGFSMIALTKFDCSYADEPAAVRSFL